MVSYDVRAFFTLVPGIQLFLLLKKTTAGHQIHKRTSVFSQNIITLLEFCCKNTYSIFQGRHFEPVHGAAMGSPISTLVASLFMEAFVSKAICTAHNPPRFWLRYVNNTFVFQQAENSQQFLQHINSIDPHI